MRLLLVMLLALSTTAFANDHKADWSACKADIEKLKCAGEDKAIDECLEKHHKDLDKKCAEVADKFLKEHKK